MPQYVAEEEKPEEPAKVMSAEELEAQRQAQAQLDKQISKKVAAGVVCVLSSPLLYSFLGL